MGGRLRTVRLDGDRLAMELFRQGLTLDDLERKSGVSLATLKRAKAGNPIYLTNARTIATALQVPLQELLHPDEPGRSAFTERGPSTIAAFPFKTIGSADTHFADGLMEDLVHRLARRLFPVISPGTTVAARRETLSESEFTTAVRSDYLVTGAVQRDADRVRVTAKAVAVRDDHVIWTGKYDRRLDDLFAAQDDLAARITEAAGNAVLESESAALVNRRPCDLSAWELAARGSWLFRSRESADNRAARELFERAVRKDPTLALAWYSLAMTHQRDIVMQWSQDPAESLRSMHRLCGEFQRSHPRDPWSLVATAYAAVYTGDRSSAKALVLDALNLDRNEAAAYSLYGQVLGMEGEPDRAIEQYEMATRLSPLDPELWSFHTATALAHFVAERYEEAVDWATRATAIRPEVPFPHGTLASALGHLGRIDEARAALQRMLALAPRTSLLGMQLLVASTNEDISRRYQEGLKAAGLH